MALKEHLDTFNYRVKPLSSSFPKQNVVEPPYPPTMRVRDVFSIGFALASLIFALLTVFAGISPNALQEAYILDGIFVSNETHPLDEGYYQPYFRLHYLSICRGWSVIDALTISVIFEECESRRGGYSFRGTGNDSFFQRRDIAFMDYDRYSISESRKASRDERLQVRNNEIDGMTDVNFEPPFATLVFGIVFLLLFLFEHLFFEVSRRVSHKVVILAITSTMATVFLMVSSSLVTNIMKENGGPVEWAGGDQATGNPFPQFQAFTWSAAALIVCSLLFSLLDLKNLRKRLNVLQVGDVEMVESGGVAEHVKETGQEDRLPPYSP